MPGAQLETRAGHLRAEWAPGLAPTPHLQDRRLAVLGLLGVDQVDVAVPGPVRQRLHLAAHPDRHARWQLVDQRAVDTGVQLGDRQDVGARLDRQRAAGAPAPADRSWAHRRPIGLVAGLFPSDTGRM